MVPDAKPFSSHEVDVGECGVEEEPLDAGGEADEVEQELALLLVRVQRVEVVDGVDPLEAEVGLLLDGGDGVDGAEHLVTLVDVRDVGVEEGEVELDVEGLLEELA